MPHSKYTVSRIRAARWVKSPGNKDIATQTDRLQLLVISTYVHGETQTSLGQVAVDILCKQVCNKYSKNRTDGTWALV